MTDKRHKPIPHGTPAGYQRCRKQPDGACTSCKKAWNSYYKARYRTRASQYRRFDPIRDSALENLAARHPSEFLDLYKKASQKLMRDIAPIREAS